jgi:hypothetical protein
MYVNCPSRHNLNTVCYISQGIILKDGAMNIFFAFLYSVHNEANFAILSSLCDPENMNYSGGRDLYYLSSHVCEPILI